MGVKMGVKLGVKMGVKMGVKLGVSSKKISWHLRTVVVLRGRSRASRCRNVRQA